MIGDETGRERSLPTATEDLGERVRKLSRPALDATASRQPTWDQACRLQGDMFAVAAELGGLALQLVWYRGYGEFGAEPWLTDTAELRRRMTAVQCLSLIHI